MAIASADCREYKVWYFIF